MKEETDGFFLEEYVLQLIVYLINLVFMYQVDVLMTPPRIEHVRTAQTQVTFGEIFQVAIHPSSHLSICVYISFSYLS